MTKRFQRRTILVKRSLQVRYMALVFLTALMAALIVGGGVYYTLAKHVLLDNPFLAPVMTRVNHLILVEITMYFGIITILSAIISHRIAGPIYRFERSAETLAEGDLTHRVGLRSGDELAEMQEAFNRMASSLQSKVQKDRQLAKRIASKLDDISRRAEEAALRPELKALKAEVEHLTREFKV